MVSLQLALHASLSTSTSNSLTFPFDWTIISPTLIPVLTLIPSLCSIYWARIVFQVFYALCFGLGTNVVGFIQLILTYWFLQSFILCVLDFSHTLCFLCGFDSFSVARNISN